MHLDQIAQQKETTGGLFYKLEEGENKLRIVSEFVSREKNFRGKKSLKWCCWIIDRRDGQVRFAEFSKSIINGMSALSMSAEYGFQGLPPYDFIVTRTGKDMETRYSVSAARTNTELTEQEKLAVSERGTIQSMVEGLDKKEQERAEQEVVFSQVEEVPTPPMPNF